MIPINRISTYLLFLLSFYLLIVYSFLDYSFILSRFFFLLKKCYQPEIEPQFSKEAKPVTSYKGSKAKNLLKILPFRFQERKKTYRKCGKQARYRDAIK